MGPVGQNLPATEPALSHPISSSPLSSSNVLSPWPSTAPRLSAAKVKTSTREPGGSSSQRELDAVPLGAVDPTIERTADPATESEVRRGAGALVGRHASRTAAAVEDETAHVRTLAEGEGGFALRRRGRLRTVTSADEARGEAEAVLIVEADRGWVEPVAVPARVVGQRAVGARRRSDGHALDVVNLNPECRLGRASRGGIHPE